MTRSALSRFGIAFLTLVGALVACSGGDVAAPAGRVAAGTLAPSTLRAARGGNGQGGGARAAHPRPVVCAPHDPIVNSGVFGPAGGTLVFGNSRLIIPGGALHDTVTITASSLGDSTSNVSFQPEGLHFAKPAGLVLDGASCSLGVAADQASVVYLAPDGTILETIAAQYDPHWKAVAAPIVHFSNYAIAF